MKVRVALYVWPDFPNISPMARDEKWGDVTDSDLVRVSEVVEVDFPELPAENRDELRTRAIELARKQIEEERAKANAVFDMRLERLNRELGTPA